jgi:hypothetical protein
MRYLGIVKHKECEALLDYWANLCGGNDVPSHAQIQPRALKEILPMVFLLDASNPAGPVYRLAGTQLCQQFGFGLRGVNFFTTWEVSSAAVASALLQTSQEELVPVGFELVATFGNLRSVDVEIVLAPLRFGDAGVVRFIGAMHISNPEPLLYSGTVLSQRLVETKIAQPPSVKARSGAMRAVRFYPSAGGSMSLRACNDVFSSCKPISQAFALVGR